MYMYNKRSTLTSHVRKRTCTVPESNMVCWWRRDRLQRLWTDPAKDEAFSKTSRSKAVTGTAKALFQPHAASDAIAPNRFRRMPGASPESGKWAIIGCHVHRRDEDDN